MKQKIAKVVCAIIAVLLVTVALPAANNYNQYKYSLKKARAKLESEKYVEAINAFTNIMSTDIGKRHSEEIKKDISKADKLKENKDIYEEGLKLIAQLEYLKAIDIFLKIPMDDSKRYKMAKGKIDECKSLYAALNIENAKNTAKFYHYDAAIEDLNLVLALDLGNKDALALKEEYTKAKEAADLMAKQIGFSCVVRDDSVIIVKSLNSEAENITIPEQIYGKSVKVIGSEAFVSHYNMKSISLPESLTTIEGGFYRCFALKKISIPKNVETISPNPFVRCGSLTHILVDAENKYYSDLDGVLYNKDKTTLLAYPEGKTNESFTIPSSVKSIDESAFGYQCNKLRIVVIPPNVIDFPDRNMFFVPENITIKVKAGSAAEKYAKSYGLRCEIY